MTGFSASWQRHAGCVCLRELHPVAGSTISSADRAGLCGDQVCGRTWPRTGLDGGNLAVAGDSVGGNMTAAVTLLAKERKGPASATR